LVPSGLRSRPEAGEKFGQARDLKIHYEKLSWTLCSSQCWHIKPVGLGLFFAHVTSGGAGLRCAGSAGHVPFSCLVPCRQL